MKSEDPGENSANLGAVDAGGRDSEYGALPGVLPADLRHRDVEPIAQPLHDRAHHAALLLERLGSVDVKLDHGGPDDHRVARVSWIS